MKPDLKYSIAFFCLLLFFSGPAPAGAQQFTLAEAVAAGLQANPGIESALRVVQGSEYEVKAARGAFLPSLTVQSSYSRYSQTGDVTSVDYLDRDIFTNSLRLSQPLFAGFAILTSYEKAKIQVEIDAARLSSARLDLIFAIQQDFLELLKLREDVATIRDAIKRLESQKSSATAFYRAGIAPHNEVLNSEVELVRAQAEMIKVKNRIKNQKMRLNTWLGRPFAQDAVYVGKLADYEMKIPFTVKTALALALKQRADLRLGQKSIALAQKDAKVKFAQYYPRVSLDFTVQHEKTEYDDYYYSSATQDSNTLGLNLQWNLFDGGTTTYSYKSAIAHIVALEKSQQDQIAKAQAAVIKAFTDIEDAKKLIAVSKKARISARENYDMAAARYRSRLGTIDTLTEAHYYLVRSSTDISSAYMQYQKARASLYYNLGVENPGLTAARNLSAE